MKRIQKPRKVRDTILIITNGEKTEKNYFNSITSYYKSMFTIKVEYKNYECDKLVEYASSIDETKYNQIWCVFDIDQSFDEGHLLIAIKLAKQNNIKIAFSNESFEVWLLFHFIDKVNPSLTRKTYIKEINRILNQNGVTCGYKKNDQELLKSIFIPRLLNASANAKKVYQKFEAAHQKSHMGHTGYPFWEWKSTTTVYQLMDTLKLILINNNEDN